MVRFIIIDAINNIEGMTAIYIPLWLDLLCKTDKPSLTVSPDLHSTMVRFIIKNSILSIQKDIEFTFHYG